MFSPRVRKIPWRRTWQPTPVFLPGESHGQRSPHGPGDCKEQDTAEVTGQVGERGYLGGPVTSETKHALGPGTPEFSRKAAGTLAREAALGARRLPAHSLQTFRPEFSHGARVSSEVLR